MKYISKIVLMGSMLIGGSFGTNILDENKVHAQGLEFIDMKEDFWAYEEIKWAQANGLIKGFDDGTFKPNNTYTEAQFATMLMRYFEDLEEVGTGKHWAQGAYNSLHYYGITLDGFDDDAVKNAPIRRGTFAHVLSALLGGPFITEQRAVEWMYEVNLTIGQSTTGTLYDRFGSDNHLTRAQAAVFFHRIAEEGFTFVSDNVKSGKVQFELDPMSNLVKKVQSVYEKFGAIVDGDGENGYFAYGNGVNQAYSAAVQTLLVPFSEGSNNYTAAGHAVNALGGSGDAMQIANAIEKVYKGDSGGPYHVGNVKIQGVGVNVQITW